MYQYHLILWKMLLITIHWFWNTILLRVTTTKMIKTTILNAHIADVIISPPKATWTARGKRRYLRRHGEGLSATPRDSKDQRKQSNKITERERVSYIVTFIVALFSLCLIYISPRGGPVATRYDENEASPPPVTPQPRVSVPQWLVAASDSLSCHFRHDCCEKVHPIIPDIMDKWLDLFSRMVMLFVLAAARTSRAAHEFRSLYCSEKIKPDTQGSKKNSHWL